MLYRSQARVHSFDRRIYIRFFYAFFETSCDLLHGWAVVGLSFDLNVTGIYVT